MSLPVNPFFRQVSASPRFSAVTPEWQSWVGIYENLPGKAAGDQILRKSSPTALLDADNFKDRG
jgi:hypothetical protein